MGIFSRKNSGFVDTQEQVPFKSRIIIKNIDEEQTNLAKQVQIDAQIDAQIEAKLDRQKIEQIKNAAENVIYDDYNDYKISAENLGLQTEKTVTENAVNTIDNYGLAESLAVIVADFKKKSQELKLFKSRHISVGDNQVNNDYNSISEKVGLFIDDMAKQTVTVNEIVSDIAYSIDESKQEFSVLNGLLDSTRKAVRKANILSLNSFVEVAGIDELKGSGIENTLEHLRKTSQCISDYLCQINDQVIQAMGSLNKNSSELKDFSHNFIPRYGLAKKAIEEVSGELLAKHSVMSNVIFEQEQVINDLLNSISILLNDVKTAKENNTVAALNKDIMSSFKIINQTDAFLKKEKV